jgi:hypothetical protein
MKLHSVALLMTIIIPWLCCWLSVCVHNMSHPDFPGGPLVQLRDALGQRPRDLDWNVLGLIGLMPFIITSRVVNMHMCTIARASLQC